LKNIKIAQILVLFACLSVFALPLFNSAIISPSFTQFLKSVSEQELIKVASKLTALIEISDDITAPNSLPPLTLHKIEEERKLLNLAKIKIFARDGRIIYSTEEADIGKRTTKDFFPVLVENQETRTDLKTVDKDQADKEIFLTETYVPIIKNGRTIGVFEIYYDMTGARQNLSKLEGRINWIILSTSLLLLCAVLASAYLTRRSQLSQAKVEAEKDILIEELSAALGEIKTLRGILPLCSFCKKVRDDSGYWKQVDVYIDQNSDADISHSICPDCVAEHYPEQYQELQELSQESPKDSQKSSEHKNLS